jgi:hypothetical protein
MRRAIGFLSEESSSFLKKRTKKLLFLGARIATGARARVQKFFGSFFQKRTLSSFCFKKPAPVQDKAQTNPHPTAA